MNTIILTEEELRGGVVVEDAHPLEYVHARNYQFETIQKNLTVQHSFQQNNGIESAYLSTLFGQYKRKHEDIQQRRIESLKNLDPQHFDTILQEPKKTINRPTIKDGPKSIFDVNEIIALEQADEEDDPDQYSVQMEENERLRQQFYKTYVEGNEVDGEEVIGTIFGREVKKGDQIVYSVVENFKKKDTEVKEMLTLKKEWLKELNVEMQQIQDQNKRLKKQASKQPICRNMDIVTKLAPALFTQYHIYFDEIFAALMDDLLIEEVEYFNEVENMQLQEAEERNKQSYKFKEIIRNQQLSTNLFGLIDQLEGFALEDDAYAD